MQKGIKATSEEIEKAGEHTKNLAMAWGGAAAVFQTASAALRRFVSATQEYVDAYATLDDAMSAVQKTTGMTRKEVELLHKSLKGIDTRTSTNELLKIAEVGGRMGIAKEEIDKFTESVNVANVALGDSFQGGAEEIATVLGKIQGLFEETRSIGIDEAFNSIGSALNSVGAASKATEGNVAQFVQRLGALPESFKPSIQDAIGLGAAFQDAGIDAEIASTAWANLLTKTAANLDKVAAAMGKPVDELRELINTNPTEFIFQLAESFKGLPIDEQASKLKELKLAGVGCTEAIGALSGNTDNFRRIMAIANEEYAKGTSMMEEYSTVNNSAAAQLEKSKKAVEDAKAALGKELIPTLTKITQSTATSIKLAIEAVKWISDHKALVIALAVAYNRQYIAHMAVVTAKKLSVKWTAMEKAGESAGTVVTNLFALAKAKLAKNTLAAANAQKALKVAFAATPWGAIITAVTTLATAFVFMRKKTDEAAESQQNLEEQINQLYNEEKRKVEDLQRIIENENSTRDQKSKAIKELKKLIPEYVAELDKEGKVVNNNKNAINDYLVALKNKIRYQSLEKALNETENKILEAEVKDRKARDAYFAQSWGAEVWDKTKSFFFGGWTKEQVMENADAELQGLYDIRRGYQKEMDKMDDELKKNTGKTYRELYNDNLLSSLDGNNSPPLGSGNDPDKKLQTRIDNFEKKLQEFRNRQQRETMEGWEKTKQTVIDSYQSMIDEATALYGEGSQKVKDLMTERDQAIVAAGQKYIEKYGKTLEDFSRKMKDWAKEAAPDSGNEMVDAVLGTQAKWLQRKTEALDQLNELLNMRDLMVADNMDTTAIDSVIDKLELSIGSMADLEAQDIQKALAKYQKDIDTFITNEQKDVTNATLTETERQKQAIREKYELEIQLIEKLKAARKAQNGEDADVSDLEAQIEKLKKLLDQQLSNVDTKSGNKTIWQQLAEFDWSKMSDNWQQGLNLMSQGLQEFANVAFDIYASIAQIQDNLMEVELQKAQETYDAKSAALKRQLDQGVISQKAYDAKLQKLNEEKEKKERKLKHEQFAREKTANIIQATISGIVAIMQGFSQAGPIGGAILAALQAVITAAQIAAIASQPNPYAKGGYIRGRQYAVMGEQGDEWVASNKLLRDRESAAVIAALDDYQRGNRLALQGITFAAPDTKTLSQAISQDRRTFASSNQTTNNYYQNSENSELLKEIRQMNEYLRDPNNRRAYISRKIQLEFDEQEQEIREMARL